MHAHKTQAAFKIIHNFACVNSYCDGIKCIRCALDIHTSLLSGGRGKERGYNIIASRCNSHTYKHPEHISVIELSTENTSINCLFDWSVSSNCIREFAVGVQSGSINVLQAGAVQLLYL